MTSYLMDMLCEKMIRTGIYKYNFNDFSKMPEGLSENEQIRFEKLQKANKFLKLLSLRITALEDVGPGHIRSIKEGDPAGKHFNNYGAIFVGNDDNDYEELNAIIDKAVQVAESRPEIKPVRAAVGELLMPADKDYKDEFWQDYGLGIISKEQIEQIQNTLFELNENDTDLEEFIDSGAYSEYCQKKSISRNIIEEACKVFTEDEDGEFRKKTTAKRAEFLINCLEDFRHMRAEKGELWASPSREMLGYWGRFNVLEDMGENSKSIVKIKVIEGTPNSYEFCSDLLAENFDQDKLINFNKEDIQKAKDMFEKNKALLTCFLNDAADIEVKGTGIGNSNAFEALNEEYTEEEIATINQFRKLMFKIGQQNKTVSKLGDDKEPVFIDALDSKADLREQMPKFRELKMLDTCYEMLREPAEIIGWTRNSREYMNVMKNIRAAQKVLRKTYLSAEDAKEAYADAIGRTLKSIDAYFIHKAQDGQKQNSIDLKYKALFRIEKVFKARNNALSGQEYVIDSDIEKTVHYVDKAKIGKALGDEYAKQAALQRVENFRKVKDTDYIETTRRLALPEEDMALPEPRRADSIAINEIKTASAEEMVKAHKTAENKVTKQRNTVGAASSEAVKIKRSNSFVKK